MIFDDLFRIFALNIDSYACEDRLGEAFLWGFPRCMMKNEQLSNCLVLKH